MRTKKQKKPRKLIDYKPKGVPCSMCKHAICVDSKRFKYYCLHPDERSWLYYGEHTCEKGEQK